MKTTQSPERLKNGAISVKYEVDQLVGLCTVAPPPDHSVRYAILEAFLVHFRCLRDFFLMTRDGDRPAKRDDVVAVDYCDGWLGVGRTQTETDRVNKWLSHLSYNRDNTPDRPVADMVSYIRTEYSRFRRLLPDDLKALFSDHLEIPAALAILIPNSSSATPTL